MKLGQKILGKKLFGEIMKRTFYGQFVAGPVSYHANEYFGFRLRKKDASCWIQDTVGITPTIARMHSFGVKSILDYSVEEDISQEEAEQREMEYGVISNLSFSFLFLTSFQLLCLSSGFAASKVSDPRRGRGQAVCRSNNPLLRILCLLCTKCHFSQLFYTDEMERYQAHKEFGDRRIGVYGARTFFYQASLFFYIKWRMFVRITDALRVRQIARGILRLSFVALRQWPTPPRWYE